VSRLKEKKIKRNRKVGNEVGGDVTEWKTKGVEIDLRRCRLIILTDN